MSDHNIGEILSIYGSDLSEKEMIEKIENKKYPKEDIKAAQLAMFSKVVAIRS